MNLANILLVLLLCLWIAITVFMIVELIRNMVQSHKDAEKTAAWEAEQHQLERERAQRDKEYHEARMKELNLK
jgi:NADH:ubiquinone oxidoreductase subunit 3 (subunit A)